MNSFLKRYPKKNLRPVGRFYEDAECHLHPKEHLGNFGFCWPQGRRLWVSRGVWVCFRKIKKSFLHIALVPLSYYCVSTNISIQRSSSINSIQVLLASKQESWYVHIYILIPGSSKYVKFLPFGRFFRWKGTNFTHLEDPGMYMWYLDVPKIIHRKETSIVSYRHRQDEPCNSPQEMLRFLAAYQSCEGFTKKDTKNGGVKGLLVEVQK